MSTADAIVIGGGAVGTSTLYHLTKLGMTNVALLDKGQPGIRLHWGLGRHRQAALLQRG